MIMSKVRDLCREEPEAVESVAEKADGKLGVRLLEILEDENPEYITPHQGYVYVVEAEPGVVKIGRSKDPERRVSQLSTGNPNTLELLASVECENALEAERRLHREYSTEKASGEWFDIGAEERDELIERLNSLEGLL